MNSNTHSQSIIHPSNGNFNHSSSFNTYSGTLSEKVPQKCSIQRQPNFDLSNGRRSFSVLKTESKSFFDEILGLNSCVNVVQPEFKEKQLTENQRETIIQNETISNVLESLLILCDQTQFKFIQNIDVNTHEISNADYLKKFVIELKNSFKNYYKDSICSKKSGNLTNVHQQCEFKNQIEFTSLEHKKVNEIQHQSQEHKEKIEEETKDKKIDCNTIEFETSKDKKELTNLKGEYNSSIKKYALLKGKYNSLLKKLDDLLEEKKLRESQVSYEEKQEKIEKENENLKTEVEYLKNIIQKRNKEIQISEQKLII
ncbi:hypothetical protein QTN25_008780 [Entamoeba marina]